VVRAEAREGFSSFRLNWRRRSGGERNEEGKDVVGVRVDEGKVKEEDVVVVVVVEEDDEEEEEEDEEEDEEEEEEEKEEEEEEENEKEGR
jgi:hypothetical protein